MKNTRPQTQTAQVTSAETESASVSRTVVEAVADAEGVSALDLSPPLYEAVDPDALEQFVDSVSADRDVSVTFAYAGFEVTVTGDGEVSLDGE